MFQCPAEVFEKAGKDSPLVFLYGSGMMLPAFEQALLNKKVNDTFEISIPAVDAYGEVNEEAIVDLPKHIFMVDGKIDEELIAKSLKDGDSSLDKIRNLVMSLPGVWVRAGTAKAGRPPIERHARKFRNRPPNFQQIAQS